MTHTLPARSIPVGARFVHPVPAADDVPVRVVAPTRSSGNLDTVLVTAETLEQGLFGPKGRRVTLCYLAEQEVEVDDVDSAVDVDDLLEELRDAIREIRDAWEGGDLARAVRDAVALLPEEQA